MASIEDKIETRIRAFVAELGGLLREGARDAVEQSLGALGAAGAAKATKAAPAKAAAKPAAAPAAPKAAPAKRGRAGAKAVAARVDQLASFIGANPGSRMENISKALGYKTEHLRRPIDILLETGVVRREGQKRAAKYYAAGAGAPAAAAPKTAAAAKPAKGGKKRGRPSKKGSKE